MRRLVLSAILLCFSQVTPGAYITDKLLAGFYDRPESDAQPLRVLSDGTPLEVLTTTEGFSRVRLGDDSEGWVESRYITREKPAKTRLLELQARYALLKRLSGPGREESVPERHRERNKDDQQPVSLLLTRQQRKHLQQTLEQVQATLLRDSETPRRQGGKTLLDKQLTESVRILSSLPTWTSGNSDYLLSLWWPLLSGLGLIFSFITGIVYKNYRLSRRPDN